MGTENRSRDLITAEVWRYRAHIALYGRLPDQYDIGERYQGDYALSRGRDYWDKSLRDDTLPSSDYHGYPIAYLQVYGENKRLQRGNWEGGENTLCADCAEHDRLEVGDDSAYYVMRQINAEITGNADMRVVRCEGCGEIIHDYETLALVVTEGDETDSTLFYASERKKATAEYESELLRLQCVTDAPWSITLVDAERMLERPVTGEDWPLEILAATDSERMSMAAHVAAGQSLLPDFPLPLAMESVTFPVMADPLPDWMIEHTEKKLSGDSSPWLQEYAAYTPLVPTTLDAATLFDVPSSW